jgi:hypothetical protein
MHSVLFYTMLNLWVTAAIIMESTTFRDSMWCSPLDVHWHTSKHWWTTWFHITDNSTVLHYTAVRIFVCTQAEVLAAPPIKWGQPALHVCFMGALSRKLTVNVIYYNVIHISLVGLDDQLCGTRGPPPLPKKSCHIKRFMQSRKVLECFPAMYLENAWVRLLKVTADRTEIIQWLRLALSDGPNRVGVSHPVTWVHKQIQFLKCCTL